MSTIVKEKASKQLYKQCVMRCGSERIYTEYVAWIPAELARIGRHVTIDEFPDSRWKIISTGDAKPEHLVDWYAEHSRNGLPDGASPSTPMRHSPPQKDKKKKKNGKR